MRPGIEPCAVFGQLAVDRTEALLEVGLGRVEDVHEKTCALEVSEELMAEAGSVGRALDEPRHVGDRQLALLRPVHHPQHRLERRERIVRDLRLGIRYPAQQRGLSGIRKTGERRVDDELEPELEVDLVSGESCLGKAWRLPSRCREAGVSAPALSSARDDDAAVR